jgi:thiosulfate/3-mercaptopyruvate sulfurtransferase
MDVTLEELRERVGQEGLFLLDVRSAYEFEGIAQTACDPRHGHIAGARNVPLERILECTSASEVRELVGRAEGTEVIAYCHSGQRSAYAVQVLRAAGYEARNYVGSWHEWSRDPSLPAEPAPASG